MDFSAETYFSTQPEPANHAEKLASVTAFIDRQISRNRRVALVTVSED